MRTALVVHAHPDDEAFATGAATWVLHDAGWRVVLRVATQGWGGTGDKLPASCELLGIDEWDWLSDPDRWIDDGGVNGPRTLASAEPDEVVAEVERAIRTLQPELILTVGSDGLTGHPDHIAISQAVRRAQKPCRALGARLRAQDVRAGEQLLQELLPGKPIGSGRVTGCDDATPLETISKAPELLRRQALDAYYEGLGTQDLPELITSHNSRSDGLLLRAVFDASDGWPQDRFELLTA
ncbi:PIG-L family deacetylase [Kribbella sp. NPDC051952]|uniref:PIG-L deacetylase family protein n=1 Tax=Kribbella sp. NPDC051952 TaxID=3154851 RepID=UPI003429EEAF